jgi:hypothetical protein
MSLRRRWASALSGLWMPSAKQVWPAGEGQESRVCGSGKPQDATGGAKSRALRRSGSSGTDSRLLCSSQPRERRTGERDALVARHSEEGSGVSTTESVVQLKSTALIACCNCGHADIAHLENTGPCTHDRKGDYCGCNHFCVLRVSTPLSPTISALPMKKTAFPSWPQQWRARD